MKLGKFLIVIMILSFFTPLFLFSQTQDEERITTVNLMINTVYSTRMGLIVEYYSGGKMRRTYFPNSFFENKIVVQIYEDNYALTPQMNVVYKNQVAYKIKLYIPSYPDGLTYQVIEFMPQDLIDKFKSITKLEVELKDVK